MLLPWLATSKFAANSAVQESHRLLTSNCYENPNSLLSLAELGFELTLSAMLAIISIHLNRNAIQRQIAEQKTADSLGYASTRTRARNSRRRS